MIRFLLLSILILLLARAFWRIMDGILEAAGGGRRRGRRDARPMRLIKDPVCGTFVSPPSALKLTGRGGATYYFCSDRCRAEFVARDNQLPQQAS